MRYVLVGGLSNVNERPVGKVSFLKVTKSQSVLFSPFPFGHKKYIK